MLNKKLIKFPRTRINQLVLSVPFKAQKEIKLPSLGSNTSQTPRLDLNQTQIVELPDIFRYHTPSPSKAIAIKKFSYDDGSERQMVNLESLIQQEATLAEILELSKSNSICDLNAKLQEYWEVSNNEAFWAIEKLFKDSRTRRSIVASLILESLSLALLMHCNEKQLVFTNINKLLRNLICCMHQNLLTLIDIILTRLPPDVLSSVWVLKLQKTAQAKKVKNLKRGEHFSSLRHHCEMISNCIRTVAHLITNNSALSILLHILTNVDKYSVRAVRSYLLPMKNYSNSVSVPFLTERSSKEFTLVIDLDETLVHFSGRKKKAGELLVRPYCAEFLKDMNELFELVIFTAGVQEVRVI